MATLYQFQQKLAKINSQKYLELALFEQIKRYENIFLRYQKEQLNEGEDAEGNIFGVYKQSTEDWDRSYTPRKPKIAGEAYNFEDTGGLFDGMRLDVFEDKAEFWSDDSKTADLVNRFKGFFGLSDERLREVIKTVIYPAFMIELRTVLGL